MNQPSRPPQWGPPPPPPSREALEAERLAREARERTLANDQLVITIWRVCGGIGIAIAVIMALISAKSGHSGLAGRILLRTVIFGGGGIGAIIRGNALARRYRPPPELPPPMPMMHSHHFSAPPFVPQTQHHQQQQQQQEAPQQPGQITRWTD